MKTWLQYLFALVLFILGVILLFNRLPPAETLSQNQAAPASSLPSPSETPGRTIARPLMRLA